MPTKTSNSKSAWSAKDIYDMIFSTYGNAHVNANKARAKEASKYMIPYIPEKEIMLTTGRYNTGKISTNLLDSIYNASQRTGVPLDIALGLAGRESTLGIGRGFKKGKSVSGTDLYSNWQQIQTIPNNKAQMKRWNSLLGRTDLTDEDYDFKSEFLIRAQDSLENTKSLDENPIDNALKFYQTGKYNPGDSRHTQMVEDDAKALMSDPAIQKWLKTKTETQMKCGGRRKAKLGLDIREGGIAIPIANNMFYINGRKHAAGGVAIGPNNKNGVEVEGGEVVEMIDSNHPSVGRQFKAGGQQQTMRVFSSVPFLQGVSPAQLVLGGANPDAVFKAQEEFKDRNRINDDGTRYQTGGQKKSNSAIRTEADKKVSAYNRAVYSLVDPTMGYPTKKEAFGYAIGAGIKAMRNPNDMVYWVTDSVSDAAWRKRHGLSYDNKFLIPNEDGSVRLPKDREMEIPTDTTMIKNRIAANKKLAKRYPEGSEKRDIVDWALKVDGMALDSLRHTYRTGEPVTINEGAYNSRRLINNGELSYPEIMPHNVMQNYAIQYDKSKGKMNYWDTYNFNDFEWGVPGKPFEIRGSIPLKRFGGSKQDDTKTAALKHLRNKFTIRGNYNGGMFGGAGAGSVIMTQPEYVNDTITKKYLVPVTQNFNDAFRNARNSGQNEFMFDGKLYNTNLGNNPNNNAAGANRTSTIIIPIEHKEVRRRKKEFGGSMIYTINGNVKNGLMSARPKAKYGKNIKIDKASYETVDEAVERYKQLYRIKYGKEASESDINRIAWTKSLENAIDGNPNLITGYGPNIGVRGSNVTKLISGTNKGRQIARTQTAVRNKNVKSATPKRQAVNTKVSEAARAERQSQFDAWQQGEAFKTSTMPTDAVAVNRPTISTGVRSGRKDRVDDVVAIQRSQRASSADKLANKKQYSNYDKYYRNKTYYNNAIAASGSAPLIGLAALDYFANEDSVNTDTNNNVESTNKQVVSSNKSNVATSISKKINTKATDTNNRYVSTTKKNTGESYVINPLTGEWIRNGVTETSEPSVKGATKVTSKPSSTPRGRGTKASTTKAASQSTPTIQDTVNKITMDAWKASKTPKIDLTKVEMPTYNVSDLGSKETKAAKDKLNTSSTGGVKEAPWVPQYNLINTRDWLGIGTNLAGHIASYFANNALLKKAPMPIKPVQFQAAKLKTTHNINPELANINEVTQMNLAEVGRNTSSSSTSIARKQRIMNEARDARNKLYGQKENIETQLINLDRRNRQDVYNRNIAAYNDWLDKTYVAKSNNLLNKQRNLTNLISGIPMAVNTMLGTIESRKSANDMIQAISSSRPNVDGRLLGIGDYYSQKLHDGRTAIYNKNHKLVKYV